MNAWFMFAIRILVIAAVVAAWWDFLMLVFGSLRPGPVF